MVVISYWWDFNRPLRIKASYNFFALDGKAYDNLKDRCLSLKKIWWKEAINFFKTPLRKYDISCSNHRNSNIGS